MQPEDKLVGSNYSMTTSGYTTGSSGTHLEHSKHRRDSNVASNNGGATSSPAHNNSNGIYSSYATNGGGDRHSSSNNYSKNNYGISYSKC